MMSGGEGVLDCNRLEELRSATLLPGRVGNRLAMAAAVAAGADRGAWHRMAGEGRKRRRRQSAPY